MKYSILILVGLVSIFAYGCGRRSTDTSRTTTIIDKPADNARFMQCCDARGRVLWSGSAKSAVRGNGYYDVLQADNTFLRVNGATRCTFK